ncbi:MAG: DMT family transporter [Bacteroidetes bacterium]|nr:DMT family transporter [Bacteroidota bacterium]
MNPTTRAYLFLHLAVLFWGVTAILGKLISFNEYVLVWHRMALVSLSFLLFRKTYTGLRTIPKAMAVKIGSIGIMVSIHWIFFYGAIKYANVSVALSIMATMSFMTSIIEPIVTKRKFQWYESALGIIIIPGVLLIFQYSDPAHLTGIIMAFLAAFFAALFTSLNKKLIEQTNLFTFSFLQISTGFIFLSVFLPVYISRFPESMYIGNNLDYVYLGMLAFFCTTIPMLLFFVALRELNAFVVNLANNLEPVYGIVLAWLILGENKEMDWRFYIGSSIIILSIFLQPVFKKRFERR